MKFILILFAIVLCSTYAPVYTDGTLTGDGSIDTPLGVNRGSEISPAQITSEQDDYDPTSWDEASVVRLDADRQIGITSFAAPDASTSPQEKTLINVGSFMIYFPMDHPDGTAANRLTGYGADYHLYPGASCKIYYDGTSDRWRIIGEENTDRKTRLAYEWSPGSITIQDYGDVTMIGSFHTATASTTSLPASDMLDVSAASSGASIYFAKSVVTYSAFASAHNYAECLVSIPTLSTGAQGFNVELQITNAPSSTSLAPNNTIGIRYNDATNSGKWQLYSKDNAGSEGTPVDLGITVNTATLYKLRLEVDKGKTEVRAYINGSYVGRLTAGLPNSVACGSRVIFYKTIGATGRQANVHNLSAGAIY